MAASTTGSANAPLPPTAASVGQVFLDRVAASGSREAFREPTADGGWRSWTWSETEVWVRSLAAGLLALGIQPQDRVAIDSSTRLEWIHADLAIMLAGAATTTVYPSTQADDIAFILSDSASRIVIAEDEKQLSKLFEVRDRIPTVEKVVLIDGVSEGDWVIDLDELARLGDAYTAEHPTAVDDTVAAVASDHLATLIYTSGTTGRPKGVELTHGNWTYEGACIQALEILRPDHVHFLWLPLVALVREGPALGAAADRLRHGRRRSGRPHRRQPRRSSSRRSWPLRRASSRRSTPASSRRPRPRAG